LLGVWIRRKPVSKDRREDHRKDHEQAQERDRISRDLPERAHRRGTRARGG
jgi:hypothetical protein